MFETSESPSAEPSREALLAEVARLRKLAAASPQVPWIADAAGRIVDFSDRWLDLTGQTREQAIGGGWLQACDPDDRERVAQAWQAAVRSGEPYDVEHRICLRDGQIRWIRARANPVRDAEGEVVEWIGATEEVHDRKLTESALRESETRYRATFENAPVGIAHVGLDGRWLRFNDALATILGYSREALLGKTFGDVTHPDDLEADWAQARQLLEGEIERYAIDKRYVRGDGETVWTALTVSLLRDENGDPLHFVSIVEDASARRAAEEDLRRTHEWLGLAMRGGRMGWWRRDFRTGRLDWSRELAEIFGITPDEFGRTRGAFLEFVHPDDRERVNAAVSASVATGKDYHVEFRFRRADGSEGWMEGRGQPFYDEAGAPLASYGVGVDITERMVAELALRRSGETFESLVRNSPLGVYAVDADFRLALVSQGAQRVFENVRPLVGRDFAEVMRTVWEEPFASEAIGLFQNTLATGESFHAPSTIERREDLGEMESYDWKIERIALPDGRLGVVCHFYDLSERQRYLAELERRVEERTAELTRANRDLDEFAYSVAHDLRAPLRTVVSTSRFLLDDASTAERLTEEERSFLQRQAKAATKLARIVDDLLGFARLANAELRKAPLDLTAVARSAAAEARRRWNRGEILIGEGMRAEGDANLVGYALTNLVDNALKFSPEGGRVTVGEAEGAFFVRDEGVGFDMAHAGKLFTAFERLVGQDAFEGTGVGLANVKRIVERHGGRVWAESEPGKGATFWFTLG